jgi:predicted RNA binding protein YcfA (HicA-like mRNA interferase family)
MPPVPAIRGAQVVKALEKTGFVVARINGSHHIM